MPFSFFTLVFFFFFFFYWLLSSSSHRWTRVHASFSEPWILAPIFSCQNTFRCLSMSPAESYVSQTSLQENMSQGLAVASYREPCKHCWWHVCLIAYFCFRIFHLCNRSHQSSDKHTPRGSVPEQVLCSLGELCRHANAQVPQLCNLPITSPEAFLHLCNSMGSNEKDALVRIMKQLETICLSGWEL